MLYICIINIGISTPLVRSLLCCTGNRTQQWCHSVLEYIAAARLQAQPQDSAKTWIWLLLKCRKCLNVWNRCSIQSNITSCVYLMLHSSSGGNWRPQHGVPDPSAPTVLRSGEWQRLFWPVWLLLSGLQCSWALEGDSQQAEHEGLWRIQVPTTDNKLVKLTCSAHHPYFDQTIWNVCNKWQLSTVVPSDAFRCPTLSQLSFVCYFSVCIPLAKCVCF